MSRSPEDGFDVPESAMLRREFGAAVLAAIAGAALPGCDLSGPPEAIVPLVDRKPGSTPGVPLDFATASDRQGYAIGLVVRSREGRPVKIEGNPRHPTSLGGTGASEQAALWDLYDPDRLRAPRGPNGGDLRGLRRTLRGAAARRGEGLHLLLPPTSSPITSDLLARVADGLPAARVHFDGCDAPGARWSGSAIAFGRAYEAHRDFARTEVVVAVGSDFLSRGPFALRASRELAAQRASDRAAPPDHRLYAIESPLSTTGAYADRRHAASAREVAAFPAELLVALAARGLAVPEALGAALSGLPAPAGTRRAFVEEVASDVLRARGKVLFEIGDEMPPSTHALGHALEALVGGDVVRHAPSPMASYSAAALDLAPLRAALEAGAVETLVVCGSNPCATAPEAAGFARAMRRAKARVVLGSHADETASLATVSVPEAHFLERWGALLAPDGTLSFVQPLIAPIFGGLAADDLLGWILGDEATARARVEALAARIGLDAHGLRRALRDGVVDGSAYSVVDAPIDVAKVSEAARSLVESTRAEGRDEDALELLLVPDPRGVTARANNGWLRELPEPITKLVWDNAALVSPSTAARLGIESGDVLRLEREGASLEIPAFVQPGQAEGTIVAWRGYGRRAGGRIASRGGVDVGPLADQRAAIAPRVRAEATGRHQVLVTTQSIAHEVGPRAALRLTNTDPEAAPAALARRNEDPPSLHPELAGAPQQWGMAIDLAKCTGCSACVVACEVENNTPVVGKTQVGLRREMHWLRIDRYYSEDEDGLAVAMQPMLCQHCEKAPCEYVCPTAATVHSSDGLNQMVYNRCVGTRFCSNNCPYKVRRFNYFDYNRDVAPVEALRMNPEVTVRARGVMEKCTFCVQRICDGEREAAVAGRPLADGEVETACQQACPSRAISFGLVSDPRSEVSRWQANPRAYAVLGTLGTRPRVRYLARIDAAREEPEG